MQIFKPSICTQALVLVAGSETIALFFTWTKNFPLISSQAVASKCTRLEASANGRVEIRGKFCALISTFIPKFINGLHFDPRRWIGFLLKQKEHCFPDVRISLNYDYSKKLGLALCFGNLCFNSFNKWHLTILPRELCFLRPSFLRMAGNNAVGVLTVCFCRRGSTVTYDLIRAKPSDRSVLLHVTKTVRNTSTKPLKISLFAKYAAT